MAVRHPPEIPSRILALIEEAGLSPQDLIRLTRLDTATEFLNEELGKIYKKFAGIPFDTFEEAALEVIDNPERKDEHENAMLVLRVINTAQHVYDTVAELGRYINSLPDKV